LEAVSSKRASVAEMFRSRWKGWRLFFGRDPSGLPPKSICISPLCKNTLPCGLAGILSFTVVRETPASEILDRLATAVEALGRATLAGCSEISFPSQGYLGGEAVLSALEEGILALKGDGAVRDLFFRESLEKELSILKTSLEKMLNGEEAWVDRHVDRFSTAELERIMSDLIRLKDAVWALERDILSQLGEPWRGISFPSSARSGRCGGETAPARPSKASGNYGRSFSFSMPWTVSRSGEGIRRASRSPSRCKAGPSCPRSWTT